VTAIRKYLPEGIQVKRDRGPGLFVSREAVESPLFRSEPLGEVWRVFPTQLLIEEFERADPGDALTRSLARFRGAPADGASIALFCEAAKLVEAPDGSRIKSLDRAIRQRAAACLRSGGGGGLFACAAVFNKIGGNGHEA